MSRNHRELITRKFLSLYFASVLLVMMSPATNAQSGCPEPNFWPKWEQCAIVYYDLSNIDFSTNNAEWNQINEAASNWNNANLYQDNAFVFFILGPPQSNAGGYLKFQNGSLSSTG